MAQPLLFGMFFRDLLGLCGIRSDGLSVLLLAIPVITIPVMWSAYRGAETSTRLAITFMSIESAVVIALSHVYNHPLTRALVPDGTNLQPPHDGDARLLCPHASLYHVHDIAVYLQ